MGATVAIVACKCQVLCPQAWESHVNCKAWVRQGEKSLYCVAGSYDTVDGAQAPKQVQDTVGETFPQKEAQPVSQLLGRSMKSHSPN